MSAGYTRVSPTGTVRLTKSATAAGLYRERSNVVTSEDAAFSVRLKLFFKPQPNERVTPTDAPYDRLLYSLGMLSRMFGVVRESNVATCALT